MPVLELMPIARFKEDFIPEGSRRWQNEERAKKQVNIITSKSKNPFRKEVGDVADIISFNKEFLGRTPSPKQQEAYLAIWGESPEVWDTRFRMVVLEIGMKGGKNYWSEGDVAYLCYRIKVLKNPHAYFSEITKRLVPYTEDVNFDIGNVSAVDETQAKLAFFDHAKNVLINTKDPKTGDNWFARYARLDLRSSFGDLKGKIITFPPDRPGMGTIRFMSFNSTAKAPEGQHYIRFYEDELSRAETKLKYREAEKLNDLGASNTAASFPNGVGKVIAWSYPNETDFDLTHKLYEDSKLDEGIFGRKLSTWDFNPSFSKDMFAHEYKADPIKAKRIRECIKPLSRDNFFQPHPEKLEEAISNKITNRVHYKTITVNRKTEKGLRPFTSFELLSMKGDKRERCFFYDLSVKKDRFTVGGGYNETIDPTKLDYFIDNDYEVTVTNKMPVVDFLLTIEPTPGKPLDFLQIGSLFTAIIKQFPNIRSFNSDHFQNEKLRQEILNKGIDAETYFFSNPLQVRLYTVARANIWINNFRMCNDTYKSHQMLIDGKLMTPSDLYVYEGKKLLKEGNKIDHAPGFSKDVQDVVVGLIHDLLDLEVSEIVAMPSSLEGLEDDKLRALCERYIDIKFDLKEKNVEDDIILVEIAKKLNLGMDDVQKLTKFVKEAYDY